MLSFLRIMNLSLGNSVRSYSRKHQRMISFVLIRIQDNFNILKPVFLPKRGLTTFDKFLNKMFCSIPMSSLHFKIIIFGNHRTQITKRLISHFLFNSIKKYKKRLTIDMCYLLVY